jgi:hypothetical protein
MSKVEDVLKYLQAGNTITSMEAFEKFQATRLSAIIYDLRKAGYDIVTINKKGNRCIYAEYKLNKESEVANV